MDRPAVVPVRICLYRQLPLSPTLSEGNAYLSAELMPVDKNGALRLLSGPYPQGFLEHRNPTLFYIHDLDIEIERFAGKRMI